jgi:amino acid transporter
MAAEAHHLHRRLTLLQATALNMSNMVGSGPFITIPLILAAMGGPQAMIGWGVGLVLAVCDGLVWSELSVAMPSSGGSYRYLKEAFDPRRFGRVMAFLFIWQFLVSGPAEIASGAIGFSQYLGYLNPGVKLTVWVRPILCLLCTLLLYRSIESVGKLAVVMWTGMMLTIGIIVTLGFVNFNAANLTPPPGAFTLNAAFFKGLGAAMLVAMYDYLGYYDVCYVAEEVKEPRRTIPASILFSVAAVALIYFLMNVSMIAVIPWQEALKSEYLASEFMERVAGRPAAVVVTVMILWTALASVFALILGGSRIIYAAARDGVFFRVFARLHPKGDFPHLALIVLGGLSAVASLFPLDTVINVLIVVRVLVQFIGQIFALMYLRWRGTMELPFRMWGYPLPALIALAGWAYVFLTAGTNYIAFAGLVVVAGLGACAVWLKTADARQ